MITFSEQECQELESCYKETRNRKVHIVLLRAKGVRRKDIIDMFCINKQTVTNYCHLYKDKGLKGLLENNYKGRQSYLTSEQLEEVKAYINNNKCKVKDVWKLIEDKFGILYSSGGISELVRRLGYVKKKMKRRPGKADPDEQEKWVEEFEELFDSLGEDEAIGFLDESGFVHNSVPGYILCKKGESKYIKSNSGRQKINVLGIFIMGNCDIDVFYTESTVDSILVREVLSRIDQNLNVSKLHLYLDNVSFHKSLKDVSFDKIELHFIPKYSPNLNLMERVWEFSKEKLLHNKYYEMFKEFIEAFCEFFRTIKTYKEELRSLLTPEFHIERYES